MPELVSFLEVDRCPHCGMDRPNLARKAKFATNDHRGLNTRYWAVYACERCGGVVSACSGAEYGAVWKMYPDVLVVDDAVPDPARSYLQQALASLSAPAGAIMLAASAVDAMLKACSYEDGSLYNRIEQAASDHLITQEMASWAHEVRLDANAQRHADGKVSLPTVADAQRSVDFVLALGQFLFVLPARVRKGLEDASEGH